MNDPVLIAGGYGVAGTQVATILRERHPDLHIIIGGRDSTKAEALADALGNAEAIHLDMSRPNPLENYQGPIGAVIATVNDLDDHLLKVAVARGVPLVDITRWTALVHRALTRVATTDPRTPILFASGWMGGLGPLLAAWAARDLGSLNSVDISIRYDQADLAGPDSFEYVDRLAERYEATVDGRQMLVNALSDRRTTTFADGSRTGVYRFDTPEQLTLPVTLGTATATTRIGFDSGASTRALVVLRRLGLMRLLSRPTFDKVRRAILYSPGAGGTAMFRVDLEGTLGAATVQVVDRAGQAHLTAAGAVVAVERALGLDNEPPEPPGARFPEQHPNPSAAVEGLRNLGIDIQLDRKSHA